MKTKSETTQVNIIVTRLEKLRALMTEKAYDAVIVPTGDYHMSEYTGDYFKCREFITGFTGSAGTAVIFRNNASEPTTDKAACYNNANAQDIIVPASGLWTDSRYFIQAEQQLAGTGIRLFKAGMPGTPKITDHLIRFLPEGSRVACDGRIISFDTFAEWYDALEDAGIELNEQEDLVGELWDTLSRNSLSTSEEISCRPPLPAGKAFEYDIKYCGRSRADKLADLCRKIESEGADAHILTSLDDIAWLLNIRGSDVHCNPVVLSYFLAYRKAAPGEDTSAGQTDCSRAAGTEQSNRQLSAGWHFRLFADPKSFDDDLTAALAEDGVELIPYEDISDALTNLESQSILLSATDTNSYLYGLIPPAVYIAESENPTQMMKAVKNNVEIENARAAHLKDGIALTKFMYWLKTSASAQETDPAELTEISAAEKLYELRCAQENFMGNSFDPIIAYGEHAAIVHYSATEETNAALQPKGLVLCDTGGHYLEGTTDVTRTIALGPLTEEELTMSTAVLKGHIALADAVFPRGLNGGNLDYLAHAPLWRLGKDYGHGTGHGVGHFLNVHEGPNYIHWTRNGNTGTTPPFEPGMITSCEPGYYCESSADDATHDNEGQGFGIRHESLILCKPYNSDNANMDLLCFEELTMVPFDPAVIDFSALNDQERRFLSDYHATIFERIAPHLEEDERTWLQSICKSFEF